MPCHLSAAADHLDGVALRNEYDRGIAIGDQFLQPLDIACRDGRFDVIEAIAERGGTGISKAPAHAV